MKTLSLKLHESLDDRLTAAARKTGQAKSAVVREALQTYLENDKTARPGSCLELAGNLVGCVQGPADLSVDRKHLRGYGK